MDRGEELVESEQRRDWRSLIRFADILLVPTSLIRGYISGSGSIQSGKRKAVVLGWVIATEATRIKMYDAMYDLYQVLS